MTDTIVTITRSNTSELYRPLVVNLAVSGTATFNTDYTVLGATSFNATSASVTIPANQTSQTITLSSVIDTIVELDETVILTVVPTAGVSSGSGSVTWTILNDDTQIGVLSVTAGNQITGWTITTDRVLSTDIVVSFSKAYVGVYTSVGSENLTIVLNAGSNSVNVPFDSYGNVGNSPFGSVTLTILPGAGYNVDLNYYLATINWTA
jgi:hypothetical protein